MPVSMVPYEMHWDEGGACRRRYIYTPVPYCQLLGWLSSKRNGSANAASTVRWAKQLVTFESLPHLLITHSAHLWMEVELRNLVHLRFIKSSRRPTGWYRRLSSPLPKQRTRILHRKTHHTALTSTRPTPVPRHQHLQCQCYFPDYNSSTTTTLPPLNSRAHQCLFPIPILSQKPNAQAAHHPRRKPNRPCALSLQLAASTAQPPLPSVKPAPATHGLPKKKPASPHSWKKSSRPNTIRPKSGGWWYLNRWPCTAIRAHH